MLGLFALDQGLLLGRFVVMDLLNAIAHLFNFEYTTSLPSQRCGLDHLSLILDLPADGNRDLTGPIPPEEALYLHRRVEYVLFEISLLRVLGLDIGVLKAEDQGADVDYPMHLSEE